MNEGQDPLLPEGDDVIDAFKKWFPSQFEITILRLQNQKARELLSSNKKEKEA